MSRSITFSQHRHRVSITTLARALSGMFVLLLGVPTRMHARIEREPITIPAGTTFVVQTVSEVSTKMPVGYRFETRLMKDLYVNGHLVSPAGTSVYGVVTRSAGGKQFGQQQLATTLNSIQWKGQLVPLVTDTAGVSGKSGGGLVKIGGGRIVGAMVAGPAGAVVGGVAGGVSSRGGRHITIPAGREIDIHLRMPVHLK